MKTVAIVGRPNVGKSTLFNRIIGSRKAIVAETPGVTRDRQAAETEWGGARLMIIDTGGLIETPGGRMDREIASQAMAAIEHADIVVLVVDGQEGIHGLDLYVTAILRRTGLPVVVGVNKLDGPTTSETLHAEFCELGLGDPVPLSALSGKGSGDLLDRVTRELRDTGGVPWDARADSGAEPDRIAVIGRPNVGKSSFVNQLLGEDRLIVHDQAGTTRDSIDSLIDFEGRQVLVVDTAGLRRRSRVDDDVEFYSTLRATSAVERADVCLLLADAFAGAANQDFRLGQQAWERGRPLVFVANKWDLIEDRGPTALAHFERSLRKRAHFLRWVPIITVSALSGLRVRKAVGRALEVRDEAARRIPTPEVNRVLRGLVARRQPPQGGRGDVRLRYGTQVAVSPPRFLVWSNRPQDVKEHYARYLVAGFRAAWGFEGAPVKLSFRKQERGSRRSGPEEGMREPALDSPGAPGTSPN